jgi:hypothetical protein
MHVYLEQEMRRFRVLKEPPPSNPVTEIPVENYPSKSSVFQSRMPV